MVKHRKVGNVQHKHASNNGSSSSSAQSDSSVGRKRFPQLSLWKKVLGIIGLSVALYIGLLGYLETRVNTPYDKEKVVEDTGLKVPDRYWGTYRPGVYFGLKSREPRSPVFGLMWYEFAPGLPYKGIRHWCNQNENLAKYGWMRHDGVNFGEQLIVDPPYNIVTSLIKTVDSDHGGHWTARINVTAVPNVPSSNLFSLIWYGALDESMGPAAPSSRLWYEDGALLGQTPQLGKFKVKFVTVQGKIINKSFSEAHAPGLHKLKEMLYSLFWVPKPEDPPLLGRDHQRESKDVNFVPVQMLFNTPFVLDIVYTTEYSETRSLQGDEYTKELEEHRKSFDRRFEEKFELRHRGYKEDEIAIARAAMSNLVGGIGYFYGAGRVRSPRTKEPVPYWRAALYTAVPSRSFFPRGFLWDEGFHGLLIGRWSVEIQMDIAAHWMDLINVEGWIPREQILGVEALSRVPKEFVVQSNAAANPPMLLIQLAHLIRIHPRLFAMQTNYRKTLDRMFTRLQAWYQWFQSTQRGQEPTSYRWRGREDNGLQLNPNTLTSGLDDYPRASHPSAIERHVDLRCWMFAAADAMATIANTLEMDSSRYESLKSHLSDEEALNELHWSSETNTYADYGLHTDDVRLVRAPRTQDGETSKMVRSVKTAPKPRLVTSAFGYVSLFPMLLKVLSPKSENLGKIFQSLDKPELLWSPYGLRSLSKSAPLYMKRNTEHDPPYWRGQIWMNINYLALSALKHYGNVDGPYQERARDLHDRLRANVVRNVLSEYKRTGYLWEQYSGDDGKGSGSRPFTGWTALIVLIMSDHY